MKFYWNIENTFTNTYELVNGNLGTNSSLDEEPRKDP